MVYHKDDQVWVRQAHKRVKGTIIAVHCAARVTYSIRLRNQSVVVKDSSGIIS